jgi:hemin uptake protein HemP
MTPAVAPVIPAPAPRPDRRLCTSDELFHGAREIVIRHGREEYRLRITRSGKLILTK